MCKATLEKPEQFEISAPLLAVPSSHLFVVPLEHDELVLQRLVLTLQIHPGHVHVIQHPLQSRNVSLHSHPHGQLVLIPEEEDTQGGRTDRSVRLGGS